MLIASLKFRFRTLSEHSATMTWTVQGGGGEPVEFHMPAWGWPLILVNAIILIPISLLVSIIIVVSAALRVLMKLVSINTNI